MLAESRPRASHHGSGRSREVGAGDRQNRGGTEGSAAPERSETTRSSPSCSLKSTQALAATRRLLFAAEVFPYVWTAAPKLAAGTSKVTSSSESSVGGVKEITALISGNKVASRDEVRGWRPSACSASRRRISRAARPHLRHVRVVVLPEADEVEINIDPKDLRVDTFCSSGPRRPERLHYDLFRRPHHAPADGRHRLPPGRRIADQESCQGDSASCARAYDQLEVQKQ